MSLHNLREIAINLGFKVWAYRDLDRDFYILKAPDGIPFQNGRPIEGTPVNISDGDRVVGSYVFEAELTKRMSEDEAWADLPKSLPEINAYMSVIKHRMWLE